MSTRKYYLRGILFPAVLLVTVYFIAYLIELNTPDQNSSEYFTDDAAASLSFLLVLVNALLVLGLSLPLMLVDFIGKNTITRFCLWFIPGGGWLLYLIGRGIAAHFNYPGNGEETFYVLANSLPYLTGLIWGYIAYSRVLREMKNGLPDLEVITKDDRKIPQSHTPPPARGGM